MGGRPLEGGAEADPGGRQDNRLEALHAGLGQVPVHRYAVVYPGVNNGHCYLPQYFGVGVLC